MANSNTPADGQPNTFKPLVLHRPSLSSFLLLAIVLLVSAWPFTDALEWLWRWWLTSAEYSHGILIPVISAFLIWNRRDLLEELPLVGSWVGVAIIIFAAFVYWIGRLATLHIVDNVGYWFLLLGVSVAFLGRKGFGLVIAPIFLLLLAIPLPVFFLNNLSSTLQSWSSNIGVLVIRAFGTTVLLQGNVIDLGVYKLEVAEACSGLRYLFPLLTLGALMGYLYQGAFWKRVVIALSSLPLTLITNSLRIGSIGLLVDHFGPAWAEGAIHDFQGWAMFMLTGALMFWLLVRLHRLNGNTVAWKEAFGIPEPAVRPAGTVTRITPISNSMVGAAVVVAALAMLHQFAPAPVDTVPARTEFAAFPDRLGPWSGHRHGLEAEYQDVLQLDDYLLSDFTGSSGQTVSLYIAYYNSQRTGQSVHSPRSCLPGGGWIMSDFGQRALPGLRVGETPLTVNRAIIELGRDKQLVYYWFQQRGRVITSEFSVKWYLLWDGLVRHRTDGALVRLVAPIGNGMSVDQADHDLQEFAAKILPTLDQYVPN